MSRPDVVIVTGSREWEHRRTVASVLEPFAPGTILIHGGCRGLDQIAGTFGRRYRFTMLELPYFDDEEGREARNESMFAMAAALQSVGHRVHGFAFPLPGSIGTHKAIRIAKRLGVPVKVIDRLAIGDDS